MGVMEKTSALCFRAVFSKPKTVNIRLLFAILCVFFFSCEARAGLKIYYIRHAEAGHNILNDWKDVPKEQWPPYVGNPGMFTPKGVAQVAEATEKLKKCHFDFIAVSPIWRARNTVLPYLKGMGAKGEIWPELAECPPPNLVLGSVRLPPPSSKILNAGTPIQLPAEEAPYFIVREDGKMNYKVAKEEPQTSADIQFVMQSVIDRICKKFGRADHSILLAGHGDNGKALLKMLTKDPTLSELKINNIGLWMVEQQTNGTFKLLILNDAPCDK